MFTFIIPLLLTIAAPQWTLQTSGVTARLRGVSAVNARVAWASGSGSTVLRTDDGGATWKKIIVTPDTLDFRDIDAIDEQTAYVLSIGNGAASRIYKTTDGGTTWTLQFRNENPKAFLDAMTFWDADHGIVIGDSVDLKFYILATENGGRVWSRSTSQYYRLHWRMKALSLRVAPTSPSTARSTHGSVWARRRARGSCAPLIEVAPGKLSETPLEVQPIFRHLFGGLSRREARCDRRRRLSERKRSCRQSRDHQRWRRNVDTRQRAQRFSFSGCLCAGHDDSGGDWSSGS